MTPTPIKNVSVSEADLRIDRTADAELMIDRRSGLRTAHLLGAAPDGQHGRLRRSMVRARGLVLGTSEAPPRRYRVGLYRHVLSVPEERLVCDSGSDRAATTLFMTRVELSR